MWTSLIFRRLSTTASVSKLAGCRQASSVASRAAATAKPSETTLARRFVAAYEAALEARPILTKSVTSGVLYGIGDTVAQTIEQRSSEAAAKPYDGARWLRAVAFGGIFYPLPAHIHYNFLERLVVVRWAVPQVRVPWVKMFIEQFVYWSYFSNACARSSPAAGVAHSQAHRPCPLRMPRSRRASL